MGHRDGHRRPVLEDYVSRFHEQTVHASNESHASAIGAGAAFGSLAQSVFGVPADRTASDYMRRLSNVISLLHWISLLHQTTGKNRDPLR